GELASTFRVLPYRAALDERAQVCRSRALAVHFARHGQAAHNVALARGEPSPGLNSRPAAGAGHRGAHGGKAGQGLPGVDLPAGAVSGDGGAGLSAASGAGARG
ncbi:unnamed protein product, partial [Effrenium voratum]